MPACQRRSAAGRRLAASSSMGEGGLGSQSSDGVVECKNFLLFAAEASQGDVALLGLALADDEHDRHFCQTVLAHFVIDFFVGEVDFATYARIGETASHRSE